MEYQSCELLIPQRGVHIHATAVVPQCSAGQKYPLVAYVHGFAGSRHENGGATLISEKLAQAGIATVRMDFAGCGDSEETAIHGTLLEMMDDVTTTIGYMAGYFPVDLAKLGLIGNSMGGRVVCELINSGHIPVKAAFLTAPAPRNTLVYGLLGSEQAYEEAYQQAKANGFYKMTTAFGAEMDLSPAWFEQMLHRNVYGAPCTFTGRMKVVYAADDVVITEDVPAECAAYYQADLFELSGGGHTFGFYSENEEVKQQLAELAQDFFVHLLCCEP